MSTELLDAALPERNRGNSKLKCSLARDRLGRADSNQKTKLVDSFGSASGGGLDDDEQGPFEQFRKLY